MGFDRSQFGGAKMKDLKKQNQDFEEKADFGSSTRPGYVKLKDGKNRVRIYPPHPGTLSFYQPEVKHWLEVESKWTDKDSGKEKTKIGPKPVFSALFHSDIGKCPIDAYIKHVYKIARDEYQDKKEQEKFLVPLKGTKTESGITGKHKFVVYADVNGTFGRVSLAKSVKNQLNKIAVGQEDDDDVISTDPFTPWDTGRAVIITYDKEEGKKDPNNYYSTAIDLKGPTELSEEDLMKFSEYDTLESMFVNVYTRKDFDMAVEGLKRFDEKSEYGIFQIEEYLDELEEIHELLPEAEEEESDEKAESKPKSKKAAPKKKEEPKEEETEEEYEEEEESESEEEESSEGDDDLPFDKDISEMTQDELEGVIRRNKLPVRISGRTKLDELREWVQEEMDILDKESLAKEDEESKGEGSSRRSKSDRLSKIGKDLKD